MEKVTNSSELDQEKTKVEPSLCKNCFEFYGDATRENLCSKCFKYFFDIFQYINLMLLEKKTNQVHKAKKLFQILRCLIKKNKKI